jgi:hypothetical protein
MCNAGPHAPASPNRLKFEATLGTIAKANPNGRWLPMPRIVAPGWRWLGRQPDFPYSGANKSRGSADIR